MTKDKNLNFKSPSKKRRGVIFWAWNNDLPEETLKEQIEAFDKMGLGGFYMHSRKGMNVKYMSKEFLDKAEFCINEAKKRGMYACLYDEDGYPSGYAGGFVSKKSEYAEKCIIFKCIENTATEEKADAFYDVEFDELGYMTAYKRIDENENAKHSKWCLSINTSKSDDQFNQNPYADLLNKAAVNEFLKETHEKYYERFSEDFGKCVRNVFTDEPRWHRISEVKLPEEGNYGVLPWTMGFEEYFKERLNADIFDFIPELFLNFKDKYSEIRYKYYLSMSELFEESFVKKYAEWCRKHNIEFTGHLDCEETLSSQMCVCGEHMPKYMHFDVPGIDVLGDMRQYTTAKQAQSIAHQTGKKNIMSELYGVTGWDMEFCDHKLGGDWQAALGVTDRVPHLAWVSMKKNGKRDCPASIGTQAPWFEEYQIIEDHFARLSEVLTRGKPIVKIGVIHPIESMWLVYGMRKTQWGKISAMNSRFTKLCKIMLLNQMDFDYISEATIPTIAKDNKIGEMQYTCIIVPQCITLRKTTVDFLKEFKNRGGRVIFSGKAPEYSDGIKTDYALDLYNSCMTVSDDEGEILKAVEENREIEVINQYNDRDLRYIYQYRKDENCSWLFVAKGTKEEKTQFLSEPIKITVKGNFIPELYNTLNGETEKAEFEQKNGKTSIYFDAFAYDSFLIRLEEGKGELKSPKKKENFKKLRLPQVMNYKLTEPNAAVLDFAQLAIDHEEFGELEYIRKIEDEVYKRLSVPNLIKSNIQPWAKPEYEEKHKIKLRYYIQSDIDTPCCIGAEDMEKLKLTLNGEGAGEINGYYVDHDIKTRPLPELKKGTNILEAEFYLEKNSSFEAMYLLGDFGVRIEGQAIRIIEKPKQLFWGDVTAQGLPFYSGSIDYEAEIETEKCEKLKLFIPDYIGACIRVYIDDTDCGLVMIPPFGAKLKNITEGKHKILLRLFGNRENTFGNLHNVGKTDNGSYKWNEKGETFSYTYKVKKFGILSEVRAELML